MLLRCKTKVNASAETVFACVDLPEHIVKWVGGAVDHVYLTERDPANPVGQRFLQKLKMGNSVRDFEGKIIAWEKPTHFGLFIPTPAYSSEAHFRITPEGPSSSTVDYSIDVTLHTLAARVIGAVLRIPLSFFVPNQIGKLKSYAESLQAKRGEGR
ncbi:MAG: SRPBCC family protein [Hyphomicrobiales bacterium]|nr:SRPBCC family protein [Hyphomicrobiales bacterium]